MFYDFITKYIDIFIFITKYIEIFIEKNERSFCRADTEAHYPLEKAILVFNSNKKGIHFVQHLGFYRYFWLSTSIYVFNQRLEGIAFVYKLYGHFPP